MAQTNRELEVAAASRRVSVPVPPAQRNTTYIPSISQHRRNTPATREPKVSKKRRTLQLQLACQAQAEGNFEACSLDSSEPSSSSRKSNTKMTARRSRYRTNRRRTGLISFIILTAAALLGGVRSEYISEYDGGGMELDLVDNGIEDQESRVFGGQEAQYKRYPYMAHIYNRDGRPYCAGTLITPDTILSAAHCADDDSDPDYVVIGKHSRLDFQSERNVETIDVQKIILHPDHEDGFDWINDHILNDIVLLKLKRQSSNTPVKLNFDLNKPNMGQPLRVMGWGITSYDKDRPRDLLTVDVDFVPNSVCAASKGKIRPTSSYERTYKGYVTKDMMCAASPGKDACSGDSGGPLIIPGNNARQDVQVGIVSWGYGCASANFPGIYARVSIQADYILDNLCNGKDDYAPLCSQSSAALAPPPTPRPTRRPTRNPTRRPTRRPTRKPSRSPTPRPTSRPTPLPAPTLVDVGGDIEWFRGTVEGGKKFDILQCQKMIVDWSNSISRQDGLTHSIWEFNNEEAYKNCDKSQARRVVPATLSAKHVIGMEKTQAVEKRFFGSLERDDCTNGRMKFKLKVRPRLQHKFPGYECDGATPMKVKTVDSLVDCRRLCKKLQGCNAIQYKYSNGRCRIYDNEPTRLVETKPLAATCEIAAQSCDQEAKLSISAFNKVTGGREEVIG